MLPEYAIPKRCPVLTQGMVRTLKDSATGEKPTRAGTSKVKVIFSGKFLPHLVGLFSTNVCNSLSLCEAHPSHSCSFIPLPALCH